MFNLYISKKLDDLDTLKETILKLFINYCVNKLGIEDDFNIFLEPKNHNIPGMSLANFDLSNNDIHCRTEGRIIIDVCRSIAHELEHLKQKQDNRIGVNIKVQDIGGEIEDEANAVAGQLVKRFINDNQASYLYKI